MTDRHALIWTRTPVIVPELPSHITRHLIPTPNGVLEILSAQPQASFPSEPRKKAILFQHGGFGHAAVWSPFLTYLSQRGYPCYALSLRGHGASWKPGFLRMVWGYGIGSMAQDLGYAVTWVNGIESGKREGGMRSEELVLIGHSAGGGLVQYFLSRGLGTVGGLVIVAGFPCFGGMGVYYNWFKNDPWFAPRYYLRDIWHPRSPLSSTVLTHRAFFSPDFPAAEVKKWEIYMPEYESMLWPLQMMIPFVKVSNVVKQIVGWGDGTSRLLVVAGEHDKLMGVTLMEKMAKIYQKAAEKLLGQASLSKVDSDRNATNVDFDVVGDSGHHLQNDLHWEEAAAKVFNFVQQL